MFISDLAQSLAVRYLQYLAAAFSVGKLLLKSGMSKKHGMIIGCLTK